MSFTPQLLGRAENAVRALLGRTLAGSGLTYHTSVLLNVIASSPGDADRAELTTLATDALKIDPAVVDAAIAELVEAEYVEVATATVRLTDRGRERQAQLKERAGQNTERLLRDLSAEDLAAAGRVLATVTERANAMLSGAPADPR